MPNLFALYGSAGDLVTAGEFLRRQNKELNPKKWTEQPHCKDCKAVMKIYDKKRALAEVGEEITGKLPIKTPCFDHPKGNPINPDCPSYFPNDLRFAELKSHHFDASFRECNAEILARPEIVEVNRGVLNMLMHALTGKYLSDDDRERMWKTTQDRFYNMEALGHFPWLLPYLLVRLEGYRTRISEDGRQSTSAFDRVGNRSFVFFDAEGNRRVEAFPCAIKCVFIYKDGKRNPQRNPYWKTKVDFPLTEKASEQLAARYWESAPVSPKQMRLNLRVASPVNPTILPDASLR